MKNLGSVGLSADQLKTIVKKANEVYNIKVEKVREDQKGTKKTKKKPKAGFGLNYKEDEKDDDDKAKVVEKKAPKKPAPVVLAKPIFTSSKLAPVGATPAPVEAAKVGEEEYGDEYYGEDAGYYNKNNDFDPDDDA